MLSTSTTSTLEQPFCGVKFPVNFSSSPDTASVIHHNVPLYPLKIVLSNRLKDSCRGYGVSPARRVLSPQLLLKKYDYVRDCLQVVLELTPCQREVTLRLLRLWAYYGLVYPKESQITEDPGCSKATFWRTVRLLKELGLVHVINRYLVRPHAQISNLYRLDGLIVVLAKYLSEHIAHVWSDWLVPWIHIPWPEFWSFLARVQGERAGLRRIAF